MNRTLLAAFVGSALAAPLSAQPTPSAVPSVRPSVFAITNATLVPVTGPRIANGTVVIQDGKIAAVGASVTVPAGAQVIDGKGLFVYPGLIDSGTRLGLVEIGSVPGGQDTQELGQFNPADAALTAVNPHSVHFPITRANGITSVITSATGGLIQGSAALIDAAGWTPDQMAESGRVAMVMTYPRIAGRGRFGGGRFGGQQQGDPAEVQSRQVRELFDYLRNAKAYNEHANPAPPRHRTPPPRAGAGR